MTHCLRDRPGSRNYQDFHFGVSPVGGTDTESGTQNVCTICRMLINASFCTICVHSKIFNAQISEETNILFSAGKWKNGSLIGSSATKSDLGVGGSWINSESKWWSFKNPVFQTDGLFLQTGGFLSVSSRNQGRSLWTGWGPACKVSVLWRLELLTLSR